MALIREPGKGTLKGLGASLPPKLPSWTTLRRVRAGQWDAEVVLMARWGGVRVPVALVPLEPTIKGPQNSRLWQRLKAYVPPLPGSGR